MTNFLKKDVFLRSFLLLATLLLFVWSTLVDSLNNASWDATFSAMRLLLLTQAVAILNNFRRGLISVLLLRIIVAVVALNGVVVAAQLLEAMNILPTNFSWLIESFWEIDDELTRKSGLFNGVLSSSLLAFLLLAFLLDVRKMGGKFIIIFAVGAIVFGSRTFLIFLPLLMLFYFRSFVGVGVVAVLLFALVLPSDMQYLLVTHFDERIVPTAQVVTSLNPE